MQSAQTIAARTPTGNGNGKANEDSSAMPKSQPNVQNWFASNGVTLLLSIIAFAASFAYMQATVTNQREKIDDLKTQIDKINTERSNENQRMIDYMASTQNVLREINGKLDGMNSKK